METPSLSTTQRGERGQDDSSAARGYDWPSRPNGDDGTAAAAGEGKMVTLNTADVHHKSMSKDLSEAFEKCGTGDLTVNASNQYNNESKIMELERVQAKYYRLAMIGHHVPTVMMARLLRQVKARW